MMFHRLGTRSSEDGGGMHAWNHLTNIIYFYIFMSQVYIAVENIFVLNVPVKLG